MFFFSSFGALAVRAVLSVAVVEKSTKQHFNIVPWVLAFEPEQTVGSVEDLNPRASLIE